jgi:hypothetical protein
MFFGYANIIQAISLHIMEELFAEYLVGICRIPPLHIVSLHEL